jgi:hypothetical protein
MHFKMKSLKNPERTTRENVRTSFASQNLLTVSSGPFLIFNLLI